MKTVKLVEARETGNAYQISVQVLEGSADVPPVVIHEESFTWNKAMTKAQIVRETLALLKSRVKTQEKAADFTALDGAELV